MSNIKGPDFIAVQVNDLERARRFYTETLGLTPAPQSPPEACLFLTEPIPFAVRKPHAGTVIDAAPGNGVALWFLCRDAVDLYDTLKEKGVELLGEPATGPFGLTFKFRDADGYVITVHDKA